MTATDRMARATSEAGRRPASDRSDGRWAPLIWPLLPLAAGFALRFYQLGHQALFIDEVFSLDLALRPWREALDLALADVHPVLYYAVLKGVVSGLPRDEWSLRLLSATCSTLALALAIGLARRLAGWRVAAWAGWMVAWSSVHLYYAQEARMYALLELLWLLSAGLLLAALRARPPVRWLPWLGWAVVTAAAIHTHFFGLLLWAVSAAASGVWLAARHCRRALGRWLVAQVVVAVAAVPLLFLLLRTLRAGAGGTWVPGWNDVTDLWLLALFGFSSVRTHFLHPALLSLPPWSLVPWWAWAALALVVTAGAAAGWWRIRGTDPARRAAWPIAVFGLAPVATAALFFGLARQPLWAGRAFVGALPWLFIALALGWSAFRRPVATLVLAALLALNLGGLVAYETRWVKDYAREAVATWEEQVPAGTPLVLDRFWRSMLWHYYAPAAGTSPVLGLARDPQGHISLVRVVADGSLRGTWVEASCQDLAEGPVAVYDPDGIRYAEADRWPPCLGSRPGWVFEAGRWRAAGSLLP